MELLAFGTLALDHQTMILYEFGSLEGSYISIAIHDSTTFDTNTKNLHTCAYIYIYTQNMHKYMYLG